MRAWSKSTVSEDADYDPASAEYSDDNTMKESSVLKPAESSVLKPAENIDLISDDEMGSVLKPADGSVRKPAEEYGDLQFAFYNITWEEGKMRGKNKKRHEELLRADLEFALDILECDGVFFVRVRRNK